MKFPKRKKERFENKKRERKHKNNTTQHKTKKEGKVVVKED